MSLYINEDTMEYPRYQGDVEREPNANWVEVIATEPPSEVTDGNMWIEDTPQKIDGQWVRTWKEVSIPPKTKKDEIEKAKMLGIDLQLLGIKE